VEVIISESGYKAPYRDKCARRLWLDGGQQVVSGLVPAVEVHELGERATAKPPIGRLPRAIKALIPISPQ